MAFPPTALLAWIDQESNSEVKLGYPPFSEEEKWRILIGIIQPMPDIHKAKKFTQQFIRERRKSFCDYEI